MGGTACCYPTGHRGTVHFYCDIFCLLCFSQIISSGLSSGSLVLCLDRGPTPCVHEERPSPSRGGARFGPLRRFCGSGFPVSSLPASLFPAELHRAGLSASPDVLSVGRFLFTVSSLGCRSQRCCVPSCLSLWPDLSASQLRFVPGSLESRLTCAMREPGEDLQEVSAGILGPTSGLPPSWAVPSHQRHSASPKLCP